MRIWVTRYFKYPVISNNIDERIQHLIVLVQ